MQKTHEKLNLKFIFDDNETAEFRIIIEIIPKPHRKYRVLWDDYHLWDSNSHNTLTYEESRETLFHKYIKASTFPIKV